MSDTVLSSDASGLGYCVSASRCGTVPILKVLEWKEKWRFKTKYQPPTERRARHRAAALELHNASPYLDTKTVLSSSSPVPDITVCIDSTFPEVPLELLENEWVDLFNGRWGYKEDISVTDARAGVMQARQICAGGSVEASEHLGLLDNMGVTLAFEKGRSSVYPILKCCRRLMVLGIGSGKQFGWRWFPSELNRSDFGSRNFDAHEIAPRQAEAIPRAALPRSTNSRAADAECHLPFKGAPSTAGEFSNIGPPPGLPPPAEYRKGGSRPAEAETDRQVFGSKSAVSPADRSHTFTAESSSAPHRKEISGELHGSAQLPKSFGSALRGRGARSAAGRVLRLSLVRGQKSVGGNRSFGRARTLLAPLQPDRIGVPSSVSKSRTGLVNAVSSAHSRAAAVQSSIVDYGFPTLGRKGGSRLDTPGRIPHILEALRLLQSASIGFGAPYDDKSTLRVTSAHGGARLPIENGTVPRRSPVGRRDGDQTRTDPSCLVQELRALGTSLQSHLCGSAP